MMLRPLPHSSLRLEKIDPIHPGIYRRLVKCIRSAKTREAEDRLISAVHHLSLEDHFRTEQIAAHVESLIQSPFLSKIKQWFRPLNK